MPDTNIDVNLADLANMAPATKEMVGNFLANHPNAIYLGSNTAYTAVDSLGTALKNSSGDNITLTFTHDFFQRKSKKGVIKYEVIDDKALGFGGFGEIRQLINSFTLLSDASNKTVVINPLKKKKPHVVKIQEHNSPRNPYSAVEKEYQLTSIDVEATYISMKPPIKINGPSGEMSLLVMRELPGYDVQDLIDDYDKYLNKIDDALALCLEMAKAIRDQVHSKNVVHRDIKPGNFMALHAQNRWIVHTIDFALSRLKIKKGEILSPEQTIDKFRRVGSPIFFAPEMMDPNKALSRKSDISSLGMLFGIILGAKDPREEIEEDEKMNGGVFDPFFHIRKIEKSGYYEFIDLFKKLKDSPTLDAEHKTLIEDLLNDMTALAKKSRPNIDGVVSRLETIIAKRQQLLQTSSPNPISNP